MSGWCTDGDGPTPDGRRAPPKDLFWAVGTIPSAEEEENATYGLTGVDLPRDKRMEVTPDSHLGIGRTCSNETWRHRH